MKTLLALGAGVTIVGIVVLTRDIFSPSRDHLDHRRRRNDSPDPIDAKLRP
jgi:hypothetical protein